MTTFLFYDKEMRPIIKEANPELTYAEIAKKTGAEWKALEDKSKYNELAKADKERFVTETAKYEKMKVDAMAMSDSDNATPTPPKAVRGKNFAVAEKDTLFKVLEDLRLRNFSKKELKAARGAKIKELSETLQIDESRLTTWFYNQEKKRNSAAVKKGDNDDNDKDDDDDVGVLLPSFSEETWGEMAGGEGVSQLQTQIPMGRGIGIGMDTGENENENEDDNSETQFSPAPQTQVRTQMQVEVKLFSPPAPQLPAVRVSQQKSDVVAQEEDCTMDEDDLELALEENEIVEPTGLSGWLSSNVVTSSKSARRKRRKLKK